MIKQKIAVVGSGIAGLAHAWSAAERGHEVHVFERDTKACGASIRNFGMVWPIGQTEEFRSIAMSSRERWQTLSRLSGIWVSACGSIHLAHRDDEWQVLNEFVNSHRESTLVGHIRLMEPSECLALSQAIAPDGFLGGMHSDMELCVNPSQAIRAIPNWLASNFEVQFRFGAGVVDTDTGWIRTAENKYTGYDRIIVCSGHDSETLFPEVFRNHQVRKCKLQMMRTAKQPSDWRLGPHLASGLTLRHYPSFRDCASLNALIDRVDQETPELNRFGIHVMASQNDQGHVILGDSHEYDDAIEPFDSAEIDQLILRELQKIIRLPSWELESRWNGTYAKRIDSIALEHEPRTNVHIATGLGGNGMTLAFGLAEQNWQLWSDRS